MRLLGKALFIIVALSLALFATARVRVVGSSMEPTMHEGQYVIVSRAHYIITKPQRGDLVVFSIGEQRDCDYIKRVAAVPGDTIEVSQGRVSLNGIPIDEPFTKGITVGFVAPRLLGPEEYFVMGDNRTTSKDSRHFGPIQSHDILGRAWIVY